MFFLLFQIFFKIIDPNFQIYNPGFWLVRGFIHSKMYFLEPSNHFKDLIWDLWQFHSFFVNVKIFLGKLFHLNWVWVARIKLLKHEGFPRFKFNDTDRFHSDLFHEFTLRTKESFKGFPRDKFTHTDIFHSDLFHNFNPRAKTLSSSHISSHWQISIWIVLYFYPKSEREFKGSPPITFNHTDRFHFDLFHNSNLLA